MTEYIIRDTIYPGEVKSEIVGKLVRCKDCTHQDGKDGQCPVQSTGDPEYDCMPDDDWYCADGERRW